jgi:choline dehydrogenase
MPRVTTGNTMAPCVIIGERAAEVLCGQYKLCASREGDADDTWIFDSML